MFLSDFIKNGAQLQAQAGSLAIAANDLTAIAAAVNQLFSCQTADFAAVANQGAQVFPTTTVTGFIAQNMRNSIYFNQADGSIFAMAPYLTAANGMKVFKYLPNGTLYNSALLDSTNSTMLSPTIAKLSNGNYVCVWAINAGSVYFAIVDQYLNVVVPKTAVSAYDVTANPFHAIALSGGGFAIAYSNSNPCNVVYDNTGAVVKAAGTLTNAAAFGVAVSITLVQLSNGNLAYGIASGSTGKLLGHAITSAAGANVLQVTLLDTGTGSSTTRVAISAMANYYGVALLTSSNFKACVLSLAGALQGAEFTDAAGGGGPNPDMKLLNDGSVFWGIYDTGSNSINIAGIPTTGGAGVVTTGFSGLSAHQNLDAVIERGFIVFQTGGACTVVQTNGAANAVYLVNQFNADSSHGGMKLLTDFSFIGWGPGSQMTGYKYLNTAIVGIAQQAVAAGNAGTVVTVNPGPGAYPCNALVGTVGKAYDHSASAIVGNKGTMFGNSASMKGV
jgi:hypothetical protein